MACKIERFVQTNISFDLGKNTGHKPSSLGGRCVVVIRQANKILIVVSLNLEFDNFNS